MTDTPKRRGGRREPAPDLLFPGEPTPGGLAGQIRRFGATTEAAPAPGRLPGSWLPGSWLPDGWPRDGWPPPELLPEDYWNAAMWEAT